MSAPYAECDLDAIASTVSIAERVATEFTFALLSSTSAAAHGLCVGADRVMPAATGAVSPAAGASFPASAAPTS